MNIEYKQDVTKDADGQSLLNDGLGMINPNNCKTCDYTKLNANREGHCYMFLNAPDDVCMIHTLRDKPLHAFGETLADAMADMPELLDELIKAGLVVPNV
jgi:hypothetical protein